MFVPWLLWNIEILSNTSRVVCAPICVMIRTIVAYDLIPPPRNLPSLCLRGIPNIKQGWLFGSES